MARSHSYAYRCDTCYGPAVVVVVKNAPRFEARRIRVAHFPRCSRDAFNRLSYPNLFSMREEAETDMLVSSAMDVQQ